MSKSMNADARQFDKVFQRLFDSGVDDVKFFVKPGSTATLEELMEQAVQMQREIDEDLSKDVTSVDADLAGKRFDFS